MLIHYVLWQNLLLLLVMNHKYHAEGGHLIQSKPSATLPPSRRDARRSAYAADPFGNSCPTSGPVVVRVRSEQCPALQ